MSYADQEAEPYRQMAKVKILIDALEKIADPRKRDHKEPDKYTECACIMNIAEEALTRYRGDLK